MIKRNADAPILEQLPDRQDDVVVGALSHASDNSTIAARARATRRARLAELSPIAARRVQSSTGIDVDDLPVTVDPSLAAAGIARDGAISVSPQAVASTTTLVHEALHAIQQRHAVGSGDAEAEVEQKTDAVLAGEHVAMTTASDAPQYRDDDKSMKVTAARHPVSRRIGDLANEGQWMASSIQQCITASGDPKTLTGYLNVDSKLLVPLARATDDARMRVVAIDAQLERSLQDATSEADEAAAYEAAVAAFDNFDLSALEDEHSAITTSYYLYAPDGCGDAALDQGQVRLPIGDTNGGTFELRNYGALEGSMYGNHADPRVGANIEIGFIPGPGVASKSISFVQVVVSNDSKGPTYIGQEEERATTELDGEAGWAVDSPSGDQTAVYGQDVHEGPLEHGDFGWRTSGGAEQGTDYGIATLSDTPNIAADGEAVEMRLVTYAIDLENGVYLGSLAWGFGADENNHVTLHELRIESMDVPTELHLRALELWNEQAAAADPTARNHPNQTPIPLP